MINLTQYFLKQKGISLETYPTDLENISVVNKSRFSEKRQQYLGTIKYFINENHVATLFIQRNKDRIVFTEYGSSVFTEWCTEVLITQLRGKNAS